MREIVFVTENIGVRPREDGYCLVEIAGIEMVNRIITGQTFHSYINPQTTISQIPQTKHGLSHDYLKDFPKFAEIAKPLIEFVGNSPLVVFDSPLEIYQLNNDLHASGSIKIGPSRFIDILNLSRTVFQGKQRSLSTLASELKVHYPSGHGALFDCELLAEVYIRLLECIKGSAASPAAGSGQTAHQTLLSRRIFIVHGRDGEARETVARFLERQGLQPIILHEQANTGRTLIEKFENQSDIGFVIILLTPDDVGGLIGEESRPRARQNVILELGYFIGKIGRARVCVLKKGDVELPSDVIGFTYVTLDNGGGWKFEIARDLRNIGYNIDLNRI